MHNSIAFPLIMTYTCMSLIASMLAPNLKQRFAPRLDDPEEYKTYCEPATPLGSVGCGQELSSPSAEQLWKLYRIWAVVFDLDTRRPSHATLQHASNR